MRPPIPIGQWGTISYTDTGAGWKARTRVRDRDGQLREIARFAPSRSKAERAIKQALLDRTASLGPNTTVAEIVQEWLRQVDEDDLSAGTKRVYRQMVNKHLSTGHLTGLPVNKLTVARCGSYLKLVSSTSGYATAKTVRTCLRASLDLAVDHDLIDLNPVRAMAPLRAPRRTEMAEGDRDVRRALTRAQRDALVAYVDGSEWARDHDLPDLVAFVAATGVRLGEACALKWDDVDLEAGTAEILSTITRVPGKGLVIQPDTKSRSGRRVLHLPAWLVNRLTLRGGNSRYTDVVFPSPLGHLRDISNTDHALKKMYVAAGFPWMTTHTLRRTVATLLDEAGLTSREVANHLGHARVSTTADYYMDRHQAVEQAREVL